MHVKIVSTAFHAPPRVETAADLAPRVGRSERWIISRTGVKTRRIAEEPVEVMGARAAREALSSGPAPDLIINASTTPRQLVPDTSVFIQQSMGLEGIPSYSVHATCLSFLVGVHCAMSSVVSGAYRRVLVVSAELGSVARNMDEKESAVLLGDGAAAAVIEGTPEGEDSCLLAWAMSTWPAGASLTQVSGCGTHRHPNDPQTQPSDNLFAMKGPAVYKFAHRRAQAFLRDFEQQSGVAASDVDLVVPHQASGPALASLPRYGFREDRIVNIIEEYGNCIAASIPMALAWAHANGRLKRGDRVLMMGTGAGLSIGAMLLRW